MGASRASCPRGSPLNARVVAGALLLPAIGLWFHRETGHLGDIEFFYDWYKAFVGGSDFYSEGPGLNYPILGVLVVCLPASLISDALSLAQYTLVLKVTLALAEVALVFAVAALLRRFAVHPLWALVIYVCPSTWAPGAWFGQIDVVTSIALVIAFIGLIDYRRTPQGSHLTLALAGFWSAILIKQLAWFTLPAIGIGLLVALRNASRKHQIAAVLSCVVLFVADPFVQLPEGWHSHLLWVWFGGGSSHADFIVAGGASLWSLIADVNVSAHAWRLAGLSAYHWGLILFVLVQIPLLRSLHRHYDDVGLVRYAALSNLAMCVLLTGVHERYFVHGSVLLLTCTFVQPWKMRALTWFVCAWWGLFVLGSVHFDAFEGWPFRWHVPAALLLIGLLAIHIAPRVPMIHTTRNAEA